MSLELLSIPNDYELFINGDFTGTFTGTFSGVVDQTPLVDQLVDYTGQIVAANACRVIIKKEAANLVSIFIQQINNNLLTSGVQPITLVGILPVALRPAVDPIFLSCLVKDLGNVVPGSLKVFANGNIQINLGINGTFASGTLGGTYTSIAYFDPTLTIIN